MEFFHLRKKKREVTDLDLYHLNTGFEYDFASLYLVLELLLPLLQLVLLKYFLKFIDCVKACKNIKVV